MKSCYSFVRFNDRKYYMEYLFKSARLGFRNWTTEDCGAFAVINADEDVMAFFPSVLTRQESDQMVDRMMNHFSEHGFTFYAVDQLEEKQLIGFIGVIRSTFEAFFTPCVEIGWRLDKKYWNKGYATEGALRVVEYASKELNLEELISITAVQNRKSAHIMKKIGMEFIGEFNHPKLDKGHELERHVVYRKTF